MTEQELDELMKTYDLFDNALLSHGYKEYMCDYELMVEVHVGPAEPGTYSYLFRYCVEAQVRTALSPALYRGSLDERLIEYEAGKDLDGVVWGVNWSQLYPGWKRQPISEKAAAWSEKVGLVFHEVIVETNIFLIALVFADLRVTKRSDHVSSGISQGYIPLR